MAETIRMRCGHSMLHCPICDEPFPIEVDVDESGAIFNEEWLARIREHCETQHRSWEISSPMPMSRRSLPMRASGLLSALKGCLKRSHVTSRTLTGKRGWGCGCDRTAGYKMTTMPRQSFSLGIRRPFDYDPPVVAWVKDGQGHHPEPLPDPNASDLDALRYDAALIKARCGVDCRIGQINGADVYDYACYAPDGGGWASSGNCGGYLEARRFLRGIEIGALAAKGRS
jgi:hypothetical protein